jgi:hypothetical protein
VERERVHWLVSHPPVLEFPDSIVKLGYKPTSDGSGLGVVSIAIGERQMEAVIDPSLSGVVLRGRGAKSHGGIRLFGEDSSGIIGVISELHLGEVVLSNVPARLEAGSGRGKGAHQGAFIGLDLLRRLAPSFDPALDTLTLRRSGQVAQTTVGTRAPMLFDAQGLRILVDGQWQSGASPTTWKLLASRPWIFDDRHGTLVLQ